jgi:hypothetical protein
LRRASICSVGRAASLGGRADLNTMRPSKTDGLYTSIGFHTLNAGVCLNKKTQKCCLNSFLGAFLGVFAGKPAGTCNRTTFHWSKQRQPNTLYSLTPCLATQQDKVCTNAKCSVQFYRDTATVFDSLFGKTCLQKRGLIRPKCGSHKNAARTGVVKNMTWTPEHPATRLQLHLQGGSPQATS